MSRLLNFIVFKIRVYKVYFRHDILKVGVECIVMSTTQNMAEKMRATKEWAATKTYICICLTSKYIIIRLLSVYNAHVVWRVWYDG